MTYTIATDFSNIFLIKEKCLWRSLRLSNPFSLALPLPYLLHFVFLLKAINLCWYLCQVSVLQKMNVLEYNKDLLFHSYTNFNFHCDLCFRAFTQQKMIWEKAWKGHSTFFTQKANLMYSKWNWNENLDISGG